MPITNLKCWIKTVLDTRQQINIQFKVQDNLKLRFNHDWLSNIRLFMLMVHEMHCVLRVFQRKGPYSREKERVDRITSASQTVTPMFSVILPKQLKCGNIGTDSKCGHKLQNVRMFCTWTKVWFNIELHKLYILWPNVLYNVIK